MKTHARVPRLLLMALMLPVFAAAPAAHADMVTDWNQTGVAAAVAAGQNSLQLSRTMALVHGAMYDAVNSIERRHMPYVVDIAAPAGASREAAAAAAAHAVLSRLFWPQIPIFDVALEVSLAFIPDGAAKIDGLTVGKEAAAKMLARRANDGSGKTLAYTHQTGPGMYQATPPENAAPVMPHWAAVEPFTLKTPNQFPVRGPAPYNSPEFARDFAEVKLMGAKNSTARTKDQTEAARFWLTSGIVTDNSAARQVALAKGTTVADSARVFALLNMAGADAYIACWEAKYRYHNWRPITAIRNAASTGNPALVGDPNWEPLLVTPAHPEYPSGHACYAGATERVLQEMFGDDNTFTLTFPAMNLTRTYRSFSQLGKEMIDARVWAGIHYRLSDEDGYDLGRRVADHALQTVLRPR
jgi:VCPO second helical-bundle domain